MESRTHAKKRGRRLHPGEIPAAGGTDRGQVLLREYLGGASAADTSHPLHPNGLISFRMETTH